MSSLTVSALKVVYSLKDNFLTCRGDMYIVAIPPFSVFSALSVCFVSSCVQVCLYVLVFRFISILCPCFHDKTHVTVIELHVVYEHV